MLKKTLFSAIVIALFIIMASSSTGCQGDESCRSAVVSITRNMYEPNIRYVGDGTFHVDYVSDYGKRTTTSYETDCDCNITYINGRKQD